jgi:hypothetical protein
VALAAVTRRNDYRDRKAVVIHRIRIAIIRFMALVAADTRIPVRTVLPLADDPRHFSMTIQTFLGLRGKPVGHCQADSRQKQTRDKYHETLKNKPFLHVFISL